jgi:hypothetical protein
MLACAGSATPEETVEVYHGHMAAMDFDGAARVVYVPAGNAAEVLAREYERDGLDYGRAEIRDREKAGPDEIEFTVAYPRRLAPGAPAVKRRLIVRRIDGIWYCVPAGAGVGDEGTD